ncbi:PDR/VanB family oxidoreductase [Derxia gummosa]|uniref:PDR/VanB family oxidoreductase n=1 Tax=Derxia gummosa DSM 723 TaxID=1121388 RepID=A0A8B6X991_9BURK|nr:PDR/VanB family oxidoreductase [Derxia gummosa]
MKALASPGRDLTFAVRVARIRDEAAGIRSYELVAPDGAALPGFEAGAHIDVHLPGGLVRQYSLCNPPGETHRYLIGVLRDPASRGGSRALHDEVSEGMTLTVGAPRNLFPLVPQAQRSLLVAGGIGITPMLAMAETLAARGADFALHYCGRSRERMAFLDRLAEPRFAGRVALHVDDGEAAQKLDLAALLAGSATERGATEAGAHALVAADGGAAPAPDAGAHLYVCGPAGFIEAVLGAARAAGWPESRLHCEFFAAEVAPHAGDRAFEVVLASSGRVVTVPADRTVAQALAEAGVDVMLSCEQGVCGTCLTRVLAGEVDHRDQYLTPEEQAANAEFTPCCSRAKSARLVIDL